MTEFDSFFLGLTEFDSFFLGLTEFDSFFGQPFAAKSGTEVKLVVDTPPVVHMVTGSEYPRDIYHTNIHDECMFHHNSKTRLMHMDSESRIKVCGIKKRIKLP